MCKIIIYDSTSIRKYLSDYLRNNNCFVEGVSKFKKDVINQQTEKIIESGYDFIVGIDEGGYYAYYISEIVKTPCLLVNPFFGTYSSSLYGCNMSNDFNKKYFILNSKHEYSDYRKTIKYRINENQRENLILMEDSSSPDLKELQKILMNILVKEEIYVEKPKKPKINKTIEDKIFELLDIEEER